MNEPKFKLGELVITPTAYRLLFNNFLQADMFLARHLVGDWGNLAKEDKEANDNALLNRGQLFSSYKLPGDNVLLIITEGDRSVTTVLLPEDY